MNYKIADKVICQIYSVPNKPKRIVYPETESQIDKAFLTEQVFEIIGVNKIIDDWNSYMFAIPDDFVGWMVSVFHTTHLKVDTKFLNKKFWEGTEGCILRKA